MPTAYPTALDTLNNPGPSDSLDTPGVFHDFQHQDANDAIEAMQAKIGVDGSAITTSLDYLIKRVNTRIAPSAAAVPSTIRGAAGQTADLTRWQSSAGTDLVRVTATGDVIVSTAGRFALGGGIIANTMASIYASAAGQVPLTLRGFAGQTADLLRLENGSGNALVRVGSNGHLTVATTSQFNNEASLSILSLAAANRVLVIRAAASQSGNMLEVQDNAGSGVLMRVGSGGDIGTPSIANPAFSSPAIAFDTGAVRIFNRNAVANVPLRVDGMAGQTGNLQEWRNSAASILARIDSAGGLAAQGIGTESTTWENVIGGNPVTGAALTVHAGAAGRVPIVAKGAASQTGNLQQWRSSADAVLASVSSAGVFTFPAGQFGSVSSALTFGIAPANGSSGLLARADHNHGTPPAPIAGITARKNSGGSDTGARPRFNFIEGTGISVTVADDAGNDEVDITVSTAGALGELDPLVYMGGF